MHTDDLKLQIENETWYISLSDTGEVSFAYSIPYEKSNECLNPLWHDWDYSPYVPEKSWSMNGVTTNTSPFVLKRKLLNSVARIINKSKVEFFYFTPTDTQRGKIYSNIVNLLISKLNGEWNTQIINETWFYFQKR